MEEEIWKPVPSKDGVMASSLGRILLPEITAIMPKGGLRIHKTKPTLGSITRAHKNATRVYRNIYNRRLGNLKVHRLVCEAFNGPCPPGLVTVHIDEDGLNNRADNLKWGTQKENLNMPVAVARFKARIGERSSIVIGQRRKEQI